MSTLDLLLELNEKRLLRTYNKVADFNILTMPIIHKTKNFNKTWRRAKPLDIVKVGSKIDFSKKYYMRDVKGHWYWQKSFDDLREIIDIEALANQIDKDIEKHNKTLEDFIS